jgi:hypothetical protein
LFFVFTNTVIFISINFYGEEEEEEIYIFIFMRRATEMAELMQKTCKPLFMGLWALGMQGILWTEGLGAWKP